MDPIKIRINTDIVIAGPDRKVFSSLSGTKKIFSKCIMSCI